MSNIVITGGAGCIGVALAKMLRIEHNVVVFDLPEKIEKVKTHLEGCELVAGSILDLYQTIDSVRGSEIVIHLAAMLGVQRTENDPIRCMEINIEGTKNVLLAAEIAGVSRFIFSSSSEVYGEPTHCPIDESFTTQGKTLYAISKLAGEELVKGFEKTYRSFDYTIFRFFNTYGPHQVAQFAISRFLYNAQHGLPIVINGSGCQVRSYCFVDDTAKAVGSAISSAEASNEVFNVGNPSQRVSLNELVDHVIAALDGRDVEIRRDERFLDGDRVANREIHNRFCDISKIQKFLGFCPEVSLSDGLQLTLESRSLMKDW